MNDTQARVNKLESLYTKLKTKSEKTIVSAEEPINPTLNLNRFNTNDLSFNIWNGRSWDITTAKSFTVGTSPNWFRVDTSGNIWSGRDTLALAQSDTFAVTNAGKLYAKNVVIDGILVSSTGSILNGGHISTGSITGDKISSATITGTNIANATISGNNINTATITGANIVNGTITSTQIGTATITGSNISLGTIKGNNIELATITGDRIFNGTITATNIATATITGNEIASATINGGNIATGTITATNITAGTITGDKISTGTITGSNIATGTINGNNLINGTITSTQIGTAVITAGNIANGTITSTQIANNTITSSQIATNTITASNIASNTITSGQIANSTITATQIASSTITAGNIANGTITSSQISATAGITGGQIATATINGGNIDNLTITAANISNLTITASKIQNQTITNGQIASNTITGGASGNLALGTITAGNILTGTITANEIAANTITASKIAVGTITANEIASNTITGNKISSSTIVTAGNGTDVGVLDGADTNWRIYAGHSTPASAPFRVSKTGEVVMTNANIKGGLSLQWMEGVTFIGNANDIMYNYGGVNQGYKRDPLYSTNWYNSNYTNSLNAPDFFYFSNNFIFSFSAKGANDGGVRNPNWFIIANGITNSSTGSTSITFTGNHVGFAYYENATGGLKLCTTIGNGTNQSYTDITGYTFTNINSFKIVGTGGTNFKYYINNTLVDTKTVYTPTGTCGLLFGGKSNGGLVPVQHTLANNYTLTLI